VAVCLASGLAAETFELDFVRTGSGGLLTGYRFDRSSHDLHLLLPEPYTFPAQLLVEHINTDLPGTTVVGDLVSGGNRREPADVRGSPTTTRRRSQSSWAGFRWPVSSPPGRSARLRAAMHCTVLLRRWH
jgi:small ligand-binding sensory domain FIST